MDDSVLIRAVFLWGCVYVCSTVIAPRHCSGRDRQLRSRTRATAANFSRPSTARWHSWCTERNMALFLLTSDTVTVARRAPRSLSAKDILNSHRPKEPTRQNCQSLSPTDMPTLPIVTLFKRSPHSHIALKLPFAWTTQHFKKNDG